MKILYVINSLASGGAEKLLFDMVPLISQIENIEIEVLLITNNSSDVYANKLRELKIKINTIPINRLYNPINILFLIKYINSKTYDIIHVHSFPAFYWVSLASKLVINKKPQLVYTEHTTYNGRRSKPYFKIIDKYIYSSYKKIISVSQKTQDNLVSWLQLNERELKKCEVINNGIIIDRFENAISYKKSELINDLNEDTILICMVSRFSEAKDQSTLIKALTYLPDIIHLILIGEGPLIEDNVNLTFQLGVNNRVHFLGFRNDVERILKTSDIIVLSSHWEGLSLASIEGMASGRPFIASRVEGLKEVVEGYGLLFSEGDPVELKSIILDLVQNSDLYADISRKCMERAKTYDINNQIRRTILLYYDLLG